MADDWAPPGTVLGQLQRGRGLGWLRAAENPSEGATALRACLVTDPRWDRQVEDRVDYYATLALALAVPATEVAKIESPWVPWRLLTLERGWGHGEQGGVG